MNVIAIYTPRINAMQFKYRGLTYQVNSQPFETVETETTAMFLGCTYRIRSLASLPDFRPEMTLRYRGSAYSALTPY